MMGAARCPVLPLAKLGWRTLWWTVTITNSVEGKMQEQRTDMSDGLNYSSFAPKTWTMDLSPNQICKNQLIRNYFSWNLPTFSSCCWQTWVWPVSKRVCKLIPLNNARMDTVESGKHRLLEAKVCRGRGIARPVRPCRPASGGFAGSSSPPAEWLALAQLCRQAGRRAAS